ncbi:putative fad binding domain-containing protein [Lasiodiplodia theobromae]|uniref:Putative FAD-linked oxidoreductprotein n=1 Tax=Lasiodiplodia theobromae TaxID=45133 RepID=A0A5N5CYB1_9PEZI|nr:putative FAD-linked oxidoreductprotein [Lasiodiplodia theobromae]KAF9641526.1 putative fad binding domain-containing protein [Lasiodiplodia theobromae]
MALPHLFTALGIFATALAASNNATSSGAQGACGELATLYPDLLLTRNSTNYTVEATHYWDMKANLKPLCIFQPTNADQVASSVTIFNKYQAHFAVRGGGHMNYAGSNNIDDGVLLALNGLDHLEILEDEGLVELGPGNRWENAYSALGAVGKYMIGGRLKSIGVPGLSLIGGVHYFANKYGYAMDNVMSYDVVLGNGTQVVANSTCNPDLFWALKGGANNFGVVTKFVSKTYDIPKISTTIQAFNESTVADFIKAVCAFALHDDPSVGAGAVITITYNATTKEISPSILGVQEGTESPPSKFAEFSSIPAVQRINNVTTPPQWHANLDSPFQMFRNSAGHHAIKPDFDAIWDMYTQWKAAVDDIADVEGLYPTFVLNMAPKSAAAVAKTNGIGNTWGLDDDASYIWWQFSTGWASSKDDLRMTYWSRSLIEKFHAANKAKNLSSEFLYMGDAADWQDVFVGFAPGNVEKMKQIRDKYDTDGVFHKLNWGGFKLGY